MSQTEWVIVRLKMQDASKFIAEAKASGAAVQSMGRAANQTGQQFHYLGGRGFWLNQLFFTMRRIIYGLTLTMGALGFVALKVGFQFNAMMEQQRLAFRIMTGSLENANKEVKFLYDLAAHGPFEFTQVIAGARQLMAFGFTVERTNQVLVALQDAMAGMGLDQAALDRATLALGQIQSSGRLLGQDLRQLQQLGLVNPADMMRRLNLPREALATIGSYNVPSEVAINAIMAYWKERFKGAAKAFQRTWIGEISTMKDYGRAMFGQMVEPLQTRLEKRVFPRVLEIMQEATKAYKVGGMEAFFKAIDEGIGKGTNFQLVFVRLRDVIMPLLGILRILAEDFLFAFRVLGVGTKVLLPFDYLMRFLYRVIVLINPVLRTLITLWVAEKTAKLILLAVTKAKVFWDMIEWLWYRKKIVTTQILLMWRLREVFWLLAVSKATKVATAATIAWESAQRISQVLMTGQIKGASGLFLKMTSLEKAVRRLRIAVLGLNQSLLTLLANPITWLVLAIVLVVAGLVILYFKWKWFHDLVNRIARWIWTHYYILALVPVVGPLAAVTVAIIKNFRKIYGWLRTLVSWTKTLMKWLGLLDSKQQNQRRDGGGDSWWMRALRYITPRFDPFKGLASGGDVIRGGFFTVGERGREIVALPAGAAVRPIESGQIRGTLRGRGLSDEFLPVKTEIYIDKKKIAEAVDSVRLDRKARK